ncbi:MAG: arylsulfotransferase family protein [Solirubrobacteraceae bacterium]
MPSRGTGSGNRAGWRNGARRSRRPSRRRRQLRLLILLALIAVPIAVALSTGGGGAAPHRSSYVSVFPIPGSRVASPETQIVFRDISPHKLSHIVVRGSRSGLHQGRVEADSDHHGGSFLPTKPFLPGERVTVSTRLAITGVRRGMFHFTVADPAASLPPGGLLQTARVPGDALHFYSRPDLSPPAIELARDAPQAPGGDLFITPQRGPLQLGPMIISPSGQLVWFNPVPKGVVATDLRVQRYERNPVLTWWQGQVRGGVGYGEDVVMNRSYQRLVTIRKVNGLHPDLHDFDLTPRGTALITAYFPVWWNASSVHGPRRQVVMDSVVQEVELRTGLVRFQWDSLDHVPLRDSYAPLPKTGDSAYDYFHVNSVAQDSDGHLVISARTTWAVYELDQHTGRVLWTLGGKNSSFRLGPGVAFAFQHDARFLPHSSTLLSVFDDGAGPPDVHKQSRAITVRLNYRRMTASLVRADNHAPSILAPYEGNVQDLPDGNQFVGWGGSPYFSEFDRRGRLIFDARFVGDNSTYRAFVFPWQGMPRTTPALATSTDGTNETVYASWNGATDVARWRVLGGSNARSLAPVAVAPKEGFETSVSIVPTPYVAVQALASSGHVLATSKAIRSQ